MGFYAIAYLRLCSFSPEYEARQCQHGAAEIIFQEYVLQLVFKETYAGHQMNQLTLYGVSSTPSSYHHYRLRLNLEEVVKKQSSGDTGPDVRIPKQTDREQ